MIEYAWVGLRLLVVGAVVLALLRRAPARWRLRVALTALTMSVFPWFLFPGVEVALPLALEAGWSQGWLLAAQAGGSGRAEASPSLLPLWWLAALASGALAFGVICVRQRRLLHRWRSVARPGNDLLGLAPERLRCRCDVRVLPNSREAGTTRFFAPEIWVGDSFLEDHKLPTVLAHELAHIRSGDPQIEWYLTLMHCLCWWHPLVWFWVWRARREMELACDEVCADALGQQSYRADLAELIWDSVPLRGGVAMVAGRSFNITRLARLARRPTLNARHRLLIPVACTLALFSVLKIQASTGTVAGEDHTSFVLCPADVESISRDVDGVAASLGLTLSDPAALRMKTQTAGAVGTWLVMVDGGGHALSPTSMTIRAPLEKHVLLRFDVTEDAERLHRYLLGESCDLE